MHEINSQIKIIKYFAFVKRN